MVKDFCNIIKVYNSEAERNVSYLSKFYQNREFLKEKIFIVADEVLNNSNLIQGKNILLKPNWVTHDRKPGDELCLRTSEAFILAFLELLLELKPAKITIGDAPIQGCKWELLLSNDFYYEIGILESLYTTKIKIIDFRRKTFNPLENNPVKAIKPLSDYVLFDLGSDSYLNEISTNKSNFRVTSYDPDKLKESHKIGVHKYLITKELFDADIVISLPKVKTHQKTGITCALKNIVGLNGDKDFLPHHRVGGTGLGGDCYPGWNLLRRGAEYLIDQANRNQGKRIYWYYFNASRIFWKLSNPKNVHQLAAGWYGNDTTWRMVMDLNTIVHYGNRDGTLSSNPVRQFYSLCDGIIGGQGDGPLNPEALPLGIISFTNNSYLNDICMIELLGFKWQKIPLIKEAFNHIESFEIKINNIGIELKDLKKEQLKTIPPPGWMNYI